MTTINATSGANLSFVDQVNSGQTCMSAEGLMIYLQTRLGSLDTRINEMFDKQENLDRIHKDINTIQKVLDSKSDDTTKGEVQEVSASDPWIDKINAAIDDVAQVDPELADQMRANLTDGGALTGGDKNYCTYEIKSSKDYLNGLSKELESSAQLQMIQLQSIMSNRQTAVQLATNLISSDNDSKKSVVNNIK